MGTLESTSTWYIFIIPLFTCMATVHQQSAHPPASPEVGGCLMEQTWLVYRCCVCAQQSVPIRHWAMMHSQLSVLPVAPAFGTCTS